MFGPSARFGWLHGHRGRLGAYFFSIGQSGATCGVSNNTSSTAYQLMQAAGKLAVAGMPWDSQLNQILQALNVFKAVNQETF